MNKSGARARARASTRYPDGKKDFERYADDDDLYIKAYTSADKNQPNQTKPKTQHSTCCRGKLQVGVFLSTSLDCAQTTHLCISSTGKGGKEKNSVGDLHG